jgi:hypothetical protein
LISPVPHSGSIAIIVQGMFFVAHAKLFLNEASWLRAIPISFPPFAQSQH